jgi:hypothetical protein
MTISKPMFPPSIVPATPQASRRALLIGLAAAATPIAPALATALSESAPAVAPIEVDPIFAVIAEHREAVRVWGEDWDDNEEMETKATGQWFAATMALLTAQPTTVDGLSALLVHVAQPEFLKENEHEVDRDSVLSGASGTAYLERAAQDFPLRVAATVRRLIGTVPEVRRAPVEPDPIYAAIEAHRAAIMVVNAADDVTCKMRGNDPGWDAASQASSEATDDEMDALRDVLSCRPTTIEGAIALLDHLGLPQFLRDSRDPATVLSGAHEWYDQEEVRAFPHMLADALAKIEAVQS